MSSAAAARPAGPPSSLPTHYRLPSDTYDLLGRAPGGPGGPSSAEAGVAADREPIPGSITARGSARSPGWSGSTGSKTLLIKRAVAVQNPLLSGGQGVTLRAVHPTADAAVQKCLRTRRTGLSSRRRSLDAAGDWPPALRKPLLRLLHQTRAPATSRSVRSRSTRLRRSSQTPRTPRTPGITSGSGTRRTVNPSTRVPDRRGRKKPTTPDWRYNPRGGHLHTSLASRVRADTPTSTDVSVNRLDDIAVRRSRNSTPACDWANAYKVFLRNGVTIVTTLSRNFAMQLHGCEQARCNRPPSQNSRR